MPSGDDHILLDCKAATKIQVKNFEFDVVGYSSSAGTFFLVESKIGNGVRDIGHAFGQILAYKAMVSQYGKRFLTKFQEKSRSKLGREDFTALFEMEEIPCRFFVAITEPASADGWFTLKSVQGKMKDAERVGVMCYSKKTGRILFESQNHHDFFLSSLSTVPYYERFDNRQQFLKDVSEKVRRLSKGRMMPKRWKGLIQLRTGIVRHTHYEVQVLSQGRRKETRRKPRIEIALDIEPPKSHPASSRIFKESLVRYVKSRLGAIDRKELKILSDWLNDGMWGRICYQLDLHDFDSNLSTETANHLCSIREKLDPILRDFEKLSQSSNLQRK